MTSVAQMLEKGWALVPIPPGRKGPTQNNWNLQSRCVSGLGHAHIFQNMNIGLAHAYCLPAPTCAIDIDQYNAAKAWLATHFIDVDSLLKAPDAVVIWSGKKYSLKLLYRLPIGNLPIASTKINGSDGRVALEFRCATRDGKTVQDLLPPSIHPSGSRYQWLGTGDPLALPKIPEPLLHLWRSLLVNGVKVAGRKFAPDLVGSPRLESPRQISVIRDALSHISSDCSYELWRNIVWSILSTRWTCAESLAQDWSQTAPYRYDDDAFWLLVNSFMPDHSNPITVGTIYYHARVGGWNG